MTTHTNLGKLTVVSLFPTGLRSNGECQATGQLRTVFWTSFFSLTKVANFEENLQKIGEFEDVCTFLTKTAHLGKFTVARVVLNKF